jgi:hypothetical protein
MNRPRSVQPSTDCASANVSGHSAARNKRWPANTARASTSAWTQDPGAGQWARFVEELTDAGIDPADLISVAAEVAADRDYPHHVRDMISRRACQLAQHACPPTATATLQAIRTHAVVLDGAGHHQQAADLWQQLITRYQTAEQPGLAQQARLACATGLHRQGRCVEALEQISLAWHTATEAVDEHCPAASTVRRLYRLMLDACQPGTSTAPARPAEPGTAPQPAASPVTTSIAGNLEHQRVCAYRSRTEGRGRR